MGFGRWFSLIFSISWWTFSFPGHVPGQLVVLLKFNNNFSGIIEPFIELYSMWLFPMAAWREEFLDSIWNVKS